MAPLGVGRNVLRAIEGNQLYIISHPEFREDIRRRCAALLAAVPDETPDPRRVAVENTRSELRY